MTILLPDFNILFLSIIESFAQILRKLDINSLRYCCASLNHLLFTQSVYIRIFVRKLQLTTSFSNYYSQIPSFAFQVKPAKCVSFCFVMKNTFEVGFALLLPHPHCVEHLFSIHSGEVSTLRPFGPCYVNPHPRACQLHL